MTNKAKQKMAGYAASALGLMVAIANAWITIDWEHFEFTEGNIIKLALSGIIATGGFISRISVKTKDEPQNN